MIHVTRLNHTSVVVNCDLIENIEATPDTVIAMRSGQKITVLESPEEIIDRIIAYHRSIIADSCALLTSPGAAAAARLSPR